MQSQKWENIRISHCLAVSRSTIIVTSTICGGLIRICKRRQRSRYQPCSMSRFGSCDPDLDLDEAWIFDSDLALNLDPNLGLGRPAVL